MLYRKFEKVIEDHLKSGSAKILLIEGGACGTIYNSDAQSTSFF